MFDLKHCGLERADFAFSSWVFAGTLELIFSGTVIGGREHTRKKGAMEYYSAIKTNEELIHVTTCVNLEHIMLSERSQSQKTIFVFFHLYEMSSIGIS